MNNATHTPGPWTVGDPDEYGDGVTIDSAEGPVAFRVIECSADLIAAAPDLLAALQDVIYLSTGIPDSESSYVANAALVKVRAAIEKATT